MIGRIFVTEHNRIVKVLYELNPHWDDEYLYQEARRINIAQYQHIIFNDLLPIVLGSKAMKEWDLNTSKYGYFKDYSQNVDPSVKNAFIIAGNQKIKNDRYSV